MIHQKEGIVQQGKNNYNFCPCFCGYVKIYTLSDEFGNVFYVGCSTDLKKRIAKHLNTRSDFNEKKATKVEQLGGKVFISTIEQKYIAASNSYFARLEMKEREMFWINKYKELGYDLCNIEGIKVKGKKNKAEDHRNVSDKKMVKPYRSKRIYGFKHKHIPGFGK